MMSTVGSAVLTFLVSGVLLLAVSSVYGIVRNYLKVQNLGIPLIISPISMFNPVWALSSPKILPYCLKLPFGLDFWFSYIGVTWLFKDRFRAHEKYGDIFGVICPGYVMFFVGDAAALDDLSSRRKDFTKPPEIYQSMELFGPNVDTVEGATWQRHRKITTPPFNERNSGLVWAESLRQAQEIQELWAQQQGNPITTTAKDTMTLALHVLTAAGFGQSYSFRAGPQIIPAGHVMTYRDALNICLVNFILLMIFNHDLLLSKWMPKTFQKTGLAAKEFRLYMSEMISGERQLIEKRAAGSGNLLSSLIRASDEGKAESSNSSLSDTEITGNLFIYNLAGHETTANTLAYAIYHLSINPEIQDWINAELIHVLGPTSSPSEWDYKTTFPRLKRTLALMYETLRLYEPVLCLPRTTGNNHQPLTVGGKTYIFPPRTYVALNTMAAHTKPEYWGPDSLTWNPKRWVDAPTIRAASHPAGAEAAENDHDREILLPPPIKGAYKPWFEGSSHVCPGKLFAKHELNAAIAVLLRDHKVTVAKKREDETWAEIRQRVAQVIEDSEVKITLQMREPEKVGLIWQRR